MNKEIRHDTEFSIYEDYRKRKNRTLNKEEFLAQFVQCPECGYRNKKVFLERTGCCNCCGKILDPKAYLKYVVNKKVKIYKKY